jgi:hypothetical protein
VAFAFILIVAPFAASDAAGADDGLKGWLIALDYALTQPGNLDQHFATHVDASSNPIVTQRLVIDNDTATSGRATVGNRFGGALGSLRLSYWSFESDDLQAGTLIGGVYPTIVGYTYGGGMYIYSAMGVAYTASSSVQANTLDLDYLRSVPISSKFTAKFLAGLRVARYEEDQGFTGNDGMLDYFQGKHLESTGGGFRVGGAAEFGLSRHFSLEAGLAVAYLLAESEGLGTSIFPSGAVHNVFGEDDHVRGTIWDYDLRGVWKFRNFDYFLGFSGSDWEGLPADPVPAAGCCSGSLAPDHRGRQSVTFTSVHAGFLWRFGRRK